MQDILSAIIAVLLTTAVIVLHLTVVKLRNQMRVVASSQLETIGLIATLFQLNGKGKNATRKNK